MSRVLEYLFCRELTYWVMRNKNLQVVMQELSALAQRNCMTCITGLASDGGAWWSPWPCGMLLITEASPKIKKNIKKKKKKDRMGEEFFARQCFGEPALQSLEGQQHSLVKGDLRIMSWNMVPNNPRYRKVVCKSRGLHVCAIFQLFGAASI